MSDNVRSAPALRKLSEQELQQVLHNIATLQDSLPTTPFFDDELVADAISIRGALDRWHDLVGDILKTRQGDTTFDELCNWDNEGGRVEHISHTF